MTERSYQVSVSAEPRAARGRAVRAGIDSARRRAKLADGWAPFLWARSQLDDGRALLRDGESRAEPHEGPTHVSVGVPVALAPDERGARRLAAWWLSTYATRMGPLYPRMLAQRFGMAAGVNAVIEAAHDGRTAELPAVAEELAREVTVFGTYDQAQDVISEWFAAGADSVNVVLPPNRPEDELTELLNAAASLAPTTVR